MSQTQQLASPEQQAPLEYMHANIGEVVPAELQEILQWITWEAGEPDEDGKFNKFPKGRDGTGDEWQKSHQWFSFEDAIDTAKKRRHAGVGIVLPAQLKDGSHLVALDYDSVELDIKGFNPRLAEILAQQKALGMPYMEVSPSGKGLRAFVSSKNSVAQIGAPNPLGGKDELFCASCRWMTVTGYMLSDGGITEATAEIKNLRGQWSKRAVGKKTKPNISSVKNTKAQGNLRETLSPLMNEIFEDQTGWMGWPEKKLRDGDGRESMMLSYAGHLRSKGHTQLDIERLCLEANLEHYEDPLDKNVVLDRARRFEKSEPELALGQGGATEGCPAWVLEKNERYAEVRRGKSVLILDNQTATETVGGVRYGPGWIDIPAFRQMHNGSRVPNGESPIAAAWLSHPARRQYQGAVFCPGETVPANVLNLWSGFAVAPVAGNVSLWLRLLEVIAPDNVTRAYVLNWLALKVQKPGAVPGTILLVKGAKGTGKNSLFEPIVRIFGSFGRVFDDAEQIAGRFTGHLQTVAFAVLDEALFTANKQEADRIKSRVTATSMTFESKGQDPVPGVNRCAYVSLSNHNHVWQATLDERRAVVVEPSSELKGDTKFWRAFHKCFEGDDGLAALLHYLQNLDIRNFDCRAIPKSKALRDQIEQTALKDPATSWWHDVLVEGALPFRKGSMNVPLNDDGPTAVKKAHLRESFSEHTSRTQAGDWANAMKKLHKWVGVGGIRTVRRGSDGYRQLMIELPSLNELRKTFDEVVGVDMGGETDE